MEKNILGKLLISFARVGLFTVGGGYAMLPMLSREVVEKRGWVSEEEMLDYYAIGQATPGVIAINVAAFVGYRQAGVLGTIFAGIGVVGPSVVIISLIAAFLSGFQDNIYVQKAFAGIRIAVAVMIIFTLSNMGRRAIKDYTGCLLAAAGFAAVTLQIISPVLFVAAVIFYAIAREMQKGKNDIS
ncbi:chromate transporter [Sedimentisphaera salicampi]|uniref:chromate transporter n=1 Tax=Sedimentisphaera salicampi TaxID=1941349 RepID=UPI000B9D364B|nr:chromate transporter [Sedimentisphaera salicampi]OXU14795.1 putative chromate transport protein [Sedimentisphaera salicampi]